MVKNIKEKDIRSREVERVEKFDVRFEEYNTDEEINSVRRIADFCFNELFNGLKNSNVNQYVYSYVVESKVIKKTYYWVNYFDEIDSQIKGARIVEVLKEVNPNFRIIFKNRLNELAKENMTYLEIKLLYDKEMETHFYSLSLCTDKYFESKYGVTLDSYYSLLSSDKSSTILEPVTIEEQYKKKMEELKSNYIKYMVEDGILGLDSEFIESDGFMSLLMVNSKFKELNNEYKNQVLQELGFIVNEEKQTLKLMRSR